MLFEKIILQYILLFSTQNFSFLGTLTGYSLLSVFIQKGNWWAKYVKMHMWNINAYRHLENPYTWDCLGDVGVYGWIIYNTFYWEICFKILNGFKYMRVQSSERLSRTQWWIFGLDKDTGYLNRLINGPTSQEDSMACKGVMRSVYHKSYLNKSRIADCDMVVERVVRRKPAETLKLFCLNRTEVKKRCGFCLRNKCGNMRSVERLFPCGDWLVSELMT